MKLQIQYQKLLCRLLKVAKILRVWILFLKEGHNSFSYQRMTDNMTLLLPVSWRNKV